MSMGRLKAHRDTTRRLARGLKWTDVYDWLVESGYFPESYVLPPCFTVKKRPASPKVFAKRKGKQFPVAVHECCEVHFPKSDWTDRHFGIIHPEIHNDIAYHLARNWKTVADALIPDDSDVTCYSFPLPVDSKRPGRVGQLRSGRMIYEFLWMTEENLAAVAYRYQYVVRADIKNFYPSIYTHSIAWALHGKKKIRSGNNRRDYGFLGNRLDKLFQYGNDQRTNGIPIGPAVSDIVSELIAAAVDRELTRHVRTSSLKCEMARFKDDYRILVHSESDARRVLRMLQAALQEYDLELSDSKTTVVPLPDGLFRPWVSEYHAVHPRKRWRFRWKEFRELYLAVLRIDQKYPHTGVIDRFLADVVSNRGNLKVHLTNRNLEKAMSMLLMLGRRRAKAFPKVMAIVESVLRSPFGQLHTKDIIAYLSEYLEGLMREEERNKYLITWISYFMVSNGLKPQLRSNPSLKDPITRSVFNNRGALFKDAKDFQLFEGCVTRGRQLTMLEHLDVFNPPLPT
jgi:hypothetical protein